MLFVSAGFVVNIPGVCLAQPADNTENNKRHMSPAKITADQQSQKKADLEITQKIRQSIVYDKYLSTYAHNVKIIKIEGMVTLKNACQISGRKKYDRGESNSNSRKK